MLFIVTSVIVFVLAVAVLVLMNSLVVTSDTVVLDWLPILLAALACAVVVALVVNGLVGAVADVRGLFA